MAKASWRLWAVVFVAVTVRLAHDLAMSATPFFLHPGLDAEWHIEWARRILAGTNSPETFFRAPGYVYFLAGVFRLFGDGPWPIHVIQAGLGGLTTWLVYRLARRFYGRRVALTAAAMTALYGPLVYFDGELLAPSLALPLFLAAMIAAVRARTVWGGLIAGLLFGAGALVLPNILIVVIVMVVALLIPSQRRPAKEAPERRSVALAFLAGTVLAVLPVVARNGITNGDWTLASQGGVNFYAGNNAAASGLSIVLPEFDPQPGWREFVSKTEAFAASEAGRPLKPSEVSTFYVRKGLTFWRTKPLQALTLQFKKVYYLLNGHEHPNNRDLYSDRRFSPVLAILLWHLGPFHFPLGLMLPLAALALFRRVGAARPLLLYLLVYGASVTLFFVTERYRLPLIPVLLIFSAAGLHEFLRSPVKLDRGTVAAALLFVIANSHFGSAGASNPAQEVMRLGEAYFDGGRFEEAAARFRTATEMTPRAPEPWGRLGGALSSAGKPAEAIQAWQHAADAGSRDPLVWFNLGTAHLGQDRPAEAARALEESVRLDEGRVEAWVNLALARGALGNRDGAVTALDRALAIDPGNPAALLEAGRWSVVAGDRAGALAAWEKALVRDPKSVDVRLNLGLLAFDDGRYDEALRRLNEARSLEPGRGDVYFHIARIEAVRGDGERALASLEEARHRGFDIKGPVSEDPAFTRYRTDPGFQALLGR